jgi:hypothetical protein
MAQFRILSGPNEDRLIDALKHRKHSHQVYFKVLPEDSHSTFRLEVFIDGLEYETDFSEDIWRITVSPVKRGERLTGLYCTRNHKGSLAKITNGDNPPISILGFDPDVEERLHKGGIHTLDELIQLAESNVVHLLLDDDLGFGMSMHKAFNCIHRFERLRNRMDVLGYSFDGSRRSLDDLYLSL